MQPSSIPLPLLELCTISVLCNWMTSEKVCKVNSYVILWDNKRGIRNLPGLPGGCYLDLRHSQGCAICMITIVTLWSSRCKILLLLLFLIVVFLRETLCYVLLVCWHSLPPAQSDLNLPRHTFFLPIANRQLNRIFDHSLPDLSC